MINKQSKWKVKFQTCQFKANIYKANLTLKVKVKATGLQTCLWHLDDQWIVQIVR